MILRKTDFKNKASAPENYIPGLSRGDTGFLTGIDTAPTDSQQTRKLKMIVEAERKLLANPNAREKADYVVNESEFDKWGGYKGKLFATEEYTVEDKEADDFFEAVELKMAQKNMKRVKGAPEQLQPAPAQKGKRAGPVSAVNPTVAFKEEKSELKQLNVQDWQAIPEPQVQRSMKRDRTKYTPVADSLLTMKIDEKMTHLQQEVAAKVETQTREEYLNTLDASDPTYDDILDSQKARLILKSACDSDPSNAKTWLAYAGFEEAKGRLQEARNIVELGLANSPENAQLWEAIIRLAPVSLKETLYQKAVQNASNKHDFWLKYADFCQDKENKTEVLKRAIGSSQDRSSTSRLWSALIALHGPQETGYQAMLSQAVEFCPDIIDFWLKWIFASETPKARLVLNKANKHFKNQVFRIWIAAACVEEQAGTEIDKIDMIVKRGYQKSVEETKANFGEEQLVEVSKDCVDRKCYRVLRKMYEQVQEQQRKAHSTEGDFSLFLRGRREAMERAALAQAADLWVFCGMRFLQSEMKLLPKELVFELFERRYNTVVLTPADQAFLDQMIVDHYVDSGSIGALIDSLEKHRINHQLTTKDAQAFIVNIAVKMTPKTANSASKESLSNIVLQCVDYLAFLNMNFTELIDFCAQFDDFETLFLRRCELMNQRERGSAFAGQLPKIEFLWKDKRQTREVRMKAANLLTEAHAESGNIALSVPVWESLCREYDTCLEARIALADVTAKTRGIMEARAIYAKILDNSASTAENWLAILEIERQHKQVQVQRNLLQKAIKNFPKDVRIRLKDLDLPTDNPKLKIHELLKLFPDSADLHNRVALHLHKEGKTEKALKFVEKALKTDPNNVDALAISALLNPDDLSENLVKFTQKRTKTGLFYHSLLLHRRHTPPDFPSLLAHIKHAYC